MFLTREAVRAVDRRAIDDYGVPGVVLMENAGRGAAEVLLSQGVRGPILICCGKGNNGGDGYVMARHLDNAGLDVHVLLFAPLSQVVGDAAVHLEIIRRSEMYLEEFASGVDQNLLRRRLAGAAWVVDALFGTGLSGPLRSPFDVIVEEINASGAPVFAVDIPSGLDADTGEPLGPTVKAQHTATFVAPKVGFANPNARRWLGQVHVVDIGAPRRAVRGLADVPVTDHSTPSKISVSS